MYVVDPPKNLKLGSGASNGVSLTWDASSDKIEGYHVYRSTSSIEGPFTRVTTDLVTSNSYLDTEAVNGNNYYMIRAVQLTRSPTASFYNPSQAAFFETNYVPPVIPQADYSPSGVSTLLSLLVFSKFHGSRPVPALLVRNQAEHWWRVLCVTSIASPL